MKTIDLTQEEKNFEILSFEELINKNYPESIWVIDSLIPEGCLTVLAGYPSSYKTWLLLDMAIKISKGEIFLEHFKTKRSKVLLIDEESGGKILQQRIKKMTNEENLDIEIMTLQSFKLEDTDKIIGICLEKNIQTVMIDSLIRIHSGDENSSSSMAKVFESFKKFKQENITLIFCHHNRKSGEKSPNPSEDMRGSSEIMAFVDNGISVRKNGKNNEIIVSPFKSRLDKEAPSFKLEILEEGLFQFQYQGEIEEKERKNKIEIAKEEIINLIIENKENNLCQKEIISILKEKRLGESSIKIAINKLCSDDIIERKQAEGNKQYYTLKS